MIQEIWMSSYGITDHQTGISIVSANIGAIRWIANYQIYNREKFMRLFQRYKTNMGRCFPSSSNYPPALQFEGESKIMIWSLFYWLVFSHIIFGQKRARNFYRTSIIIVRKIYRPFLSFPVVVSFSMFASLDYLVVLAHLFQANVLGLLGFCYLVNKDRKLQRWDILVLVTWPS